MSYASDALIDALERDVDKLERENGQLRYENDKLRELASELHQCSRQCGCDRCGYKDGCSMFDRMRELGIEVDE